MWNRIVTWLLTKDISDEIDAVQRFVVRSCDFLPAVATVATLLARPGIASAAAAGVAICTALHGSTSVPQGLLSNKDWPDVDIEKGVVDGIEIEGTWIR